MIIWVWWYRTLACSESNNYNNYMWKSAPIRLWSNLLLCPITSLYSGLTSVTQVRFYHWVTLSTGLILDICGVNSVSLSSVSNPQMVLTNGQLCVKRPTTTRCFGWTVVQSQKLPSVKLAGHHPKPRRQTHIGKSRVGLGKTGNWRVREEGWREA